MIYFDNSATTQAAPAVLETYTTVSQKIWGNPSSLHNFGETAFHLLEQSRQQIAGLLGVQAHEISSRLVGRKAIIGFEGVQRLKSGPLGSI
ncbi:Cysteine desulfurase [Lactiplantibacillus plantarum subsp. plantarum]|uniref:Cysteine desulfurase n=1 Tax=Lactiplantibacillus plantarum subsp. plantarum TaxID=337330 RepID=A0A2S3U755_LACPN|nr:Cysteine desulfurase [Lactiplantibacillus plantarum subsp. plantarum]